MTNLTIVTDTAGTLIAAVHGHEMTTNKDGVTASISFPMAHQLHKVQVEDSLFTVNDPIAFHEAIQKHLAR